MTGDSAVRRTPEEELRFLEGRIVALEALLLLVLSRTPQKTLDKVELFSVVQNGFSPDAEMKRDPHFLAG